MTRSPPEVPGPALAPLSHDRFWRDRFWEEGWVCEATLDGQRFLAVRTAAGTRLYSRSVRDVTAAFPEIAEALDEQADEGFEVESRGRAEGSSWEALWDGVHERWPTVPWSPRRPGPVPT